MQELENLTAEQRITIALNHSIAIEDQANIPGLQYALQLVKPDGWRHIAPAWADCIAHDSDVGSDELVRACKQLIANDHKIEAIKLFRSRTGCTLGVAKDAIDKIAAGLR